LTFIPDDFARAVVAFRGAKGAAWLLGLNASVEECAARWSLEVGLPFLPLSYNYVATATRADGARLVLKVCFPDAEAATEREALRLFDGRGSVRLLDSDEERGALLLERLEPGTTLAEMSETDDEASGGPRTTRTTSLPSRVGAKASADTARASTARRALSRRDSSKRPKHSSAN
jgi:streptomycin 6-kinase